MTTNRKFLLAAAFTLLITAVIWIASQNRTDEATSSTDGRFAWFESGPFEVGVTIIPATPRVGENELLIKVRLPNGDPVTNAEVSAYAEMPAMGSMPAMRAAADLSLVTKGEFAGVVDLRMRGAWPLTVNIVDPVLGNTSMTFDLATDRPELRVSTGGRPKGSAATQQGTAAIVEAAFQDGTITIDSRRRQLIGVETDQVTHHDLVRTVRAIGNVTFDERRMSKISLKYDAWIGELDADFLR